MAVNVNELLKDNNIFEELSKQTKLLREIKSLLIAVLKDDRTLAEVERDFLEKKDLQ